MVFNIEGTDSNEAASLVREIAPDLRATYAVFWTRDTAYPKNRTLCRMLGVDPDVPSARPMWRGDVVVAFAQDDHSISDENLSMIRYNPPVDRSLFWKPSFHWKDVPAEAGASAMMAAFFRSEYTSPGWFGSYQSDLEIAQESVEDGWYAMSSLGRLAATLWPLDWLRDAGLKSAEHSLKAAQLQLRW
ncbi:hypothetical protein CYLTODRAFT_489948 [Cylindrobasidium torrendii FP15055 ss-10]|uniref:Uncharacterized protein n=1 Tax=Cylindrobasidium torrendii FP15055 ss-10 TaxID=1314674 RepID=A0A0D7BDD8_9AGAR|nr:hypothetical protein CYLTODRAFT_489948 [Cylindrobasidium torrendii FP15055 ss-10]